MMITELTPEQRARFSEFADKWIAIGRCTEPANREQAEAGINLAYQNAGLEPPQQIVWCTSPLAMYLTKRAMEISVGASVGASVRDSVRASVRASVGDSVRDSVWGSVWASVGASVWDSVWDSVRASVGASVRASVRASVWDSVYGQHDASWLAFFDYLATVCQLADKTDKLGGLQLAAQNAGWWLPLKNICFVSERHNILKFDAEDRLHCADGASIAYPDGWSIYHWHGVWVHEDIIMKPITFDQINAEENAEIKRVMIERFGEDEFVKALGAEPLDATEWGKFYRVDYGDSEPLCLVRVIDPSTDRVYFNQVPPTDDNGKAMLRAKQAIAWRFGMSEAEYMPLQEA